MDHDVLQSGGQLHAAANLENTEFHKSRISEGLVFTSSLRLSEAINKALSAKEKNFIQGGSCLLSYSESKKKSGHPIWMP